MAAGRVPEENCRTRVAGLEHFQGAARDVFERRRPTAARVAGSAVLERPRVVARVRERRAQRPRVPDVVVGEPATAVNEDREATRCVASWPPLEGELERVGTIRDAPVLGARVEGGDGRVRHALERLQRSLRPGRALKQSQGQAAEAERSREAGSRFLTKRPAVGAGLHCLQHSAEDIPSRGAPVCSAPTTPRTRNGAPCHSWPAAARPAPAAGVG